MKPIASLRSASLLGPPPRAGRERAFTLIEMLVVIGIIILILGIALPNIGHISQSSALEASSRQLMSDLSLARARAVSGRTPVAVVFIPSDIIYFDITSYPTQQEKDQVRQLQAGFFTQYALFSFRRTGDQPGRSTPRYLTEWKTLPEKTFIATNKFVAVPGVPVLPFDVADFPFPFATSTSNALPYVAFNAEGRLSRWDATGNLQEAQWDARIPLARGGILYTRDANGGVTSFDIQEVPPGNSITASNHIVIDWLTGRARLEHAEVR